MTHDTPAPEFTLSPKVAFLLELGRALQRYGAPAHRLEEALTWVARRLGMQAQYFCVPTAFFAFLGEKGHRQRAYLERTNSGDTDLAKLSDVYGVAREVAQGRKDVEAAHAKLRRLVAAPPRWSPPLHVAGCGLSGAAAAILFGGGWLDVFYGGLTGLLSGLAPLLVRVRPGLSGLTAMLGAFLVSLGAGALGSLGYPCSPMAITLAGLVYFLPGLGLVVAMNELATGHLVSGTTRLAGIGMIFLQLAFGVVLGHSLGERWFHPVVHAAPHPPGWVLVPMVAVIALAFLVIFQARLRDYGWIALACGLAYGGSRLGAMLVGAEVGVGFGALGLGVASNLFSRRYDRPSLTMLLPGLMVLVPGSWGFRSVGYLLQDQVVLGLNTAVHMGSLAMALLVGLLLANAVVRPRMVL